jgi:hypothetical protein
MEHAQITWVDSTNLILKALSNHIRWQWARPASLLFSYTHWLIEDGA